MRVEDGTKLATTATLSALGAKEDNNVTPASESVAILARFHKREYDLEYVRGKSERH